MDVWWIDEPWLLGGANPTTDDLEELRSRGFNLIVSLLEEDLQAPHYDLARVEAMGYARHNIPVMDFHPPQIEQLGQFVELLAQQPQGTKAVVHCYAGVGRTGTFGAAYWIAKGLGVGEALKKIRSARPQAVETVEQHEALERFARRVRRKGKDSRQ